MIIVFVIGMIALQSYGQDGFKWNKVDSVNKTKSQIYSDTKMYIAKTWNSAQDVIQNDDKDGGSILIKGLYTKDISMVGGMQVYRYVYNYTVSFLMKDNRFKIILNDVHCSSVTFMTNPSMNLPKVEPFEGECPKTGGVNKSKVVDMMVDLKIKLQNIVDSYSDAIKATSVNNW